METLISYLPAFAELREEIALLRAERTLDSSEERNGG